MEKIGWPKQEGGSLAGCCWSFEVAGDREKKTHTWALLQAGTQPLKGQTSDPSLCHSSPETGQCHSCF